jgi:N-acetylneuraminic acid mutarotase
MPGRDVPAASAALIADGTAGGHVTVPNPSAFFPKAMAFLSPPNGEGSWSSIASMADNRQAAMSATLPDGKILVFGGFGTGGIIRDSAETYNPDSELGNEEPWVATGSLAQSRWLGTGTALVSGKVLAVAGQSIIDDIATPLNSAELYDPEEGTWSSAGTLSVPRWGHRAIRLQDGKVLVVGGQNDDGYIAAAEIYDPEENDWSAAAPMSVARFFPLIALLPNGHVLVAGGQGTDSTPLDSCEVYDPSLDSWRPTGSMTVTRQSVFSAVTFADGKILAAGGHDGVDRLASAEIFDPTIETWSATAPMLTTHYAGRAVLLPDGRALVIGGSNFSPGAEIFDPTTGLWSLTGNMQQVARYFFESAVVSGSRVLAIGGTDISPPTLATAEIFALTPPRTASAVVIVDVDLVTGKIGLRLARDPAPAPAPLSAPRYGRDNMTPYTVAGGWSLFQPSQYIYKA